MKTFVICILLQILAVHAVDFQPQCCAKAISDLRNPNSSLRDNGRYFPASEYGCLLNFDLSDPVHELRVPYWWCTKNCGGYEKTSGGTPPEWTNPLLQFLLPAIYFSMNVPRTNKLEVPDALFDSTLPHVGDVPNLLISLVISGVIVVLDVTTWVICVIAFAGPMLFSGLTEALLDFKIVQWFEADDGALQNRRPLNIPERLEILLVALSGNLDRDHQQPQQELRQAVLINDESTGKQGPLPTRLRCMMASQYSFGTTIGGPVLFYLGNMLYTVVGLATKRGDNYTAHSLAFGLFWMIIVHVAIVSGCLLASNNPSTAETIAGLSTETPTSRSGIFHELFAPVYRSRYRPVWMWSRGREKMHWLEDTGAWNHPWYRGKVELSVGNWFFIIFGTNVLLCLPCLAAAYVAYKTPRIGLSCRSMTFLTYYCAQQTLILLAWIRRYRRRSHTHSRMRKVVHVIEYVSMGFAVAWSVFTAAGSTFMQITGVFSNCRCSIPIGTWWKPYNEWIPLSGHTEEDRASSGSWELAGNLAIGFLAFVCYIGWWYQRYIRRKFVVRVRSLGKPSPTDLPPQPNLQMEQDSSDNIGQSLRVYPQSLPKSQNQEDVADMSPDQGGDGSKVSGGRASTLVDIPLSTITRTSRSSLSSNMLLTPERSHASHDRRPTLDPFDVWYL